MARASERRAPGLSAATTGISGRRGTTFTACPGDAAYALLPTWRQRVSATPDLVFSQSGPCPPSDRLGVIEP